MSAVFFIWVVSLFVVLFCGGSAFFSARGRVAKNKEKSRQAIQNQSLAPPGQARWWPGLRRPHRLHHWDKPGGGRGCVARIACTTGASPVVAGAASPASPA
jgi:hypothetical protein